MSAILFITIGSLITFISFGNFLVWLKLKNEDKKYLETETKETVLEKRYTIEYLKQTIYILNNRNPPKKAYSYIFEKDTIFPSFLIENWEKELAKNKNLHQSAEFIKKIYLMRKIQPIYFNWISATGLLIYTSEHKWVFYEIHNGDLESKNYDQTDWYKMSECIIFNRNIPFSSLKQTQHLWMLFWYCHRYKWISLEDKYIQKYKDDWIILIKNM